MNRFISLLALTAFSTTAQAQSWSDFDAAFELFPCSDGWAGCLVGGEPIQPDLKSDGSGVPRPAAMRVDWFSLEATDAFSPFVGLSDYTGELRWKSEVPEEIVPKYPGLTVTHVLTVFDLTRWIDKTYDAHDSTDSDSR